MDGEPQAARERRGMLSVIEAMVEPMRLESRRSGTLVHVECNARIEPELHDHEARALEAALIASVRACRNAEMTIRIEDAEGAVRLSLITNLPEGASEQTPFPSWLREFAELAGGEHHGTRMASILGELVQMPHRAVASPGSDVSGRCGHGPFGPGLTGTRIGVLGRSVLLSTTLPEMLRAHGAEVLEFPCARDADQTLVQRLAGFDLVISDDAKLAGQFGHLIDDFGLITRSVYVSRGLCAADVEDVNAEHWSFPMMSHEILARLDSLSQGRGWRVTPGEVIARGQPTATGQEPMVCIVDSNLARRAKMVGRAMTAGFLCMSCSSRKALRNLLKLWRFNAVLIGGESASEVAEVARVACTVAPPGSVSVLAVEGSGPKEVMENPRRFGLSGTISADNLALIRRSPA